jgi:hypothetical protein
MKPKFKAFKMPMKVKLTRFVCFMLPLILPSNRFIIHFNVCARAFMFAHQIIREAHAKLQSFATRLNETNGQQTQLMEQLKKQLADERAQHAAQIAALQKKSLEQSEVCVCVRICLDACFS